MEKFFSELLAIGGVAGLIVGVWLWYMFNSMKNSMDEQKANQINMREQISKLTEKNEKIEGQFRDYIITNASDLMNAFTKNTEVTGRLLDFFNGSFAEYMNIRAKAQDKLGNNIENLVREIRSQNKANERSKSE